MKSVNFSLFKYTLRPRNRAVVGAFVFSLLLGAAQRGHSRCTVNCQMAEISPADRWKRTKPGVNPPLMMTHPEKYSNLNASE